MEFLIQTGFTLKVEDISKKIKDTAEFFKLFSYTFLIPPVKQIFLSALIKSTYQFHTKLHMNELLF